jgi:hypothetical protein
MTFAAGTTLLERADVVTTMKEERGGDLNVTSSEGKENNDVVNTEEEKKGGSEGDSPIKVTHDTSNDNKKILRRQGSSSFIRANDLNIPSELQLGGIAVSSSTLHDAMRSQGGRSATTGMFFLDHDLKLVLDELVLRGFSEATDESLRYAPGRETAFALKRSIAVDPNWPIRPWHAANPRNLKEILIWNGLVDKKNGFGHEWPVVKARGIIPASPKRVAEFLWNSDNVSKYNSMSQGRHDGIVFQEGIDTLAEASEFGFPGCAKVFKSYNKIKLVPRTVELVSILHARALEPPLAAPGTYIIVNRSIWESDTAPTGQGQPNSIGSSSNNNKLIRSEVLLGVQLLRPLMGGKACEITTIAHALAPGLNKTVAKAAANVSAAKILRDIQAHTAQM